MVSTGMGYVSMSMPTKTLEELVLSKRLDHGGHPVLAWNIANVVLEQDAAANIKPSRPGSKDRIDGAVALILAISRALPTEERKQTVYKERGVSGHMITRLMQIFRRTQKRPREASPER